MRIYIGTDHREQEAYAVAYHSAARFGHSVQPVYEERLRLQGLMTRPVDRRGRMYDLNSAAEMSTDFAISRFFVPMLAHSGWALFVDCDVVFLADPEGMMRNADPTKAVIVVKHPDYSKSGVKMDGQKQQPYHRKLWSSVMLINCEHEANRRLNLTTLNQWPGRDLHAFRWLADSEIGSLPAEWNWLVGMAPKPDEPFLAHFTLGTPNMPGRERSEFAEIWFDARREIES